VVFWSPNCFCWQYLRYLLHTYTSCVPGNWFLITGSVITLCWFTASALLIKVEGGADIYATFRWSQKLLYDNGRFSVDIPFRFPYFVNPLPKVFMKREKIQLTVNSGFSKEVLLQGTSHPLKVVFNFFIIMFWCAFGRLKPLHMFNILKFFISVSGKG
jgi:hypothetical protein